MDLHVVILAAGNGRRMVSELPKVLHRIGGRSMLEHVVSTAAQLKPAGIHVVYGVGGDAVKAACSHLPDINWVFQAEQLGTGHAVQQALPHCGTGSRVLVLYGDVPLISVRSLRELLNQTTKQGLGLIVTEVPDPAGFGRIVRNKMGNIIAIVEERDASSQEREIREINTGILTASVDHLKAWLALLKNDNKQGEYYLTDSVACAVEAGVSVGGVRAYSPEEVQGVNDRWQQAIVERYYQRREAQRLAHAGVALADLARVDVRGSVKAGRDVFIDIGVIFEGSVEIGDGCTIGAYSVLKDVTLGSGTRVLPYSILEGAKIGSAVTLGPFARIRSGSVIKDRAKVGNFVEIKKTTLGEGSKASHLSYLGDATLGAGVNIGAGTITCNYDGKNKWTTRIEDHVFIGSNTALVAPVSIGKNAVIGAGSVITQDAPANAQTVSLQLKQRSKKHVKAGR